MKYKHVFFDLDRTLWNFEKSALEAFESIYYKFNLDKKGIDSFEKLHAIYTIHNNMLWDKYRKGEIEKSELMWRRFYLTMRNFGIDNRLLAEKVGEEYLSISPTLVNLFPYAIEILEYLHTRYTLHIITNGFSEVQKIKLMTSGMVKYFKTVVTSEDAGVKKPETGIFLYAFKNGNARSSESIMIGDDVDVDIIGARNVGMDQILFDPDSKYNNADATYIIKDLSEIEHIL